MHACRYIAEYVNNTPKCGDYLEIEDGYLQPLQGHLANLALHKRLDKMAHGGWHANCWCLSDVCYAAPVLVWMRADLLSYCALAGEAVPKLPALQLQQPSKVLAEQVVAVRRDRAGAGTRELRTLQVRRAGGDRRIQILVLEDWPSAWSSGPSNGDHWGDRLGSASLLHMPTDRCT